MNSRHPFSLGDWTDYSNYSPLTKNMLNVYRISYFYARSRRVFSISWFQTFTLFWRLHSFFLLTPQRLNFMCRRFVSSVPKRWNTKFRSRGVTQKKEYNIFSGFYRCTVHSDIHTVHSPTDAHLLKLWLKFTLKFVGSYMFRSTTVIRELVIEPG